jgi:NADH-quinone oxidoreductase subunit G
LPVEIALTKIFVENKPYDIEPDQSLLQACLSLGFNLPYFCWHPALGSVGACRQCAVKQFRDEKDARGRLVMSCMTPASEGTRVSIEDAEATAFRRGIIEGLMLNHPHDCPVCDEGGECHLQDMTVMTGHVYRRTIYHKRTFRNQNLGPLVNHEMNRCIQCYRCVRYYREYAGGTDLDAFSSGHQVYFGRYQDGTLENEFAGNLVEICPTGVFTDKTLKRHYARKWDQQFAPTVCVHCGLGCNVSAGERYGTLRRIVNRYHGEVNGYFLCDRGRFGYEFVNSAQRVGQPLLRKDGKLQPIAKARAMEYLAGLLAGEKRAIGIGSPRASLESNFVLRAMVGPERFYSGLSDEVQRLTASTLEILRRGPARPPSLSEIERSDAVLILGEDVTNIAPRLALALRQSVRQQPMRAADHLKIPRWLDHPVRELIQDQKGPLYIATPAASRLDDVATETYRAAPDDIARLGFAVARALDVNAPDVPGLTDADRALAGRIAQALKSAERPLVVSGPSLNSEAVLQAATNVAWALCAAGRATGLSLITLESNTLGAGMMGGGTLGDALQAVNSGAADTVVILENDLYLRAPAQEVDNFLNSARHVIVLDSLATATAQKAELVLPAGTFAESDGTLVSSEGRAQRFFQVYVPQGEIQSSWRWLREIMVASGQRAAAAWQDLDDVVASVGREIPALAGADQAAPPASFRMAGAKVPREPHRYSGRTAMLANINVSEPKPPQDPDSPLAFSMEGSPNQPPSSLIPFFWSPGWNSIQSVNKFQSEVAGPLRGGDPGVRLIEPPTNGKGSYFTGVPKPFEASAGRWLLIPLYHIFGSEELSRLAPGIAELSPGPYVALNPEDALALHAAEGTEMTVTLGAAAHRLPVKIAPSLAKGLAGLPAGIPPFEGAGLPVQSRISRA